MDLTRFILAKSSQVLKSFKFWKCSSLYKENKTNILFAFGKVKQIVNAPISTNIFVNKTTKPRTLPNGCVDQYEYSLMEKLVKHR